MCKREAGDTWYSYAFRQVCEKSWAVLAIAGFVVLWWYSGKMDLVQQGIIDRAAMNQEIVAKLMRETLQAQAEQTRAIIVLTNEVEELAARIEKLERSR